MRESELSWSNLLLGLKSRGLEATLLGIADGALGFWKALSKVYPTTKHQLCWLHKSRNILNKLPDSVQIEALFNDKYPKAVASLTDNLAKLLTFLIFQLHIGGQFARQTWLKARLPPSKTERKA